MDPYSATTTTTTPLQRDLTVHLGWQLALIVGHGPGEEEGSVPFFAFSWYSFVGDLWV